jgi:hypothetical protein
MTTLARLSFWVPPARQSEFESRYADRVLPFLRRHGLVASSQAGRPTPAGVFSRLFALAGPA